MQFFGIKLLQAPLSDTTVNNRKGLQNRIRIDERIFDWHLMNKVPA